MNRRSFLKALGVTTAAAVSLRIPFVPQAKTRSLPPNSSFVSCQSGVWHFVYHATKSMTVTGVTLVGKGIRYAIDITSGYGGPVHLLPGDSLDFNVTIETSTFLTLQDNVFDSAVVEATNIKDSKTRFGNLLES